MGRFSGYLFLSDYDLSFTAHGGAVPEANLTAVRSFMEEGGLFAVSTGRSVPLFLPMARKTPANAPFLFCNGAVAYDVAAERTLFESSFDPSIWDYMEDLKAHFPQFHYELQCPEGHFAWSVAPDRQVLFDMLGVKRFDAVPHSPGHPVDFAFIGGPFYYPGTQAEGLKTLDPHWDTDFEAVIRYIRGTSPYRPVRSMRHITEFMPEGVSKGSGARRLLEALHCHTLVTLGDAPNDFDMLEAADLAFMPADGYVEAGKTLRADLHVVCPCGDGAVAGVVEMLKKL